MKIKSLLSFLIILLFFTQPVLASNCSYNSTQARVQKNINDPWKRAIVIKQNENINVGSFHNETGQFATDTKLEIVKLSDDGENHLGWYENGQNVVMTLGGNYLLKVTTNNQSGASCEAKAFIAVKKTISDEDNITSTQARIQKDNQNPWVSELTIIKGETFNVGSFHNETGQFAEDTLLKIYDEKDHYFGSYRNGRQVYIARSGKFYLKVTTRGKSGNQYEDTAVIIIENKNDDDDDKNKITSTQARVQLDVDSSWVKNLGIDVGKSFNVGSFHNNSSQFADDTELKVIGPFIFGKFKIMASELVNGENLKIYIPGKYILEVTTKNKSGLIYEDKAYVRVGYIKTIDSWWQEFKDKININ